jgi:hypothetical protein
MTDALQASEIPYWIWHLITISLVFAQAIMVNKLMTKYELVEKQTYLPAFIFLTLTSLIPQFLVLNPAIVSYFFVLLAFDQLFRIPDSQHTIENLFFTALLVSIGTLFYWPVTAFVMIMLAGTLWFKTAEWRNFVIVLIGYLLPYYFLGIYFYYTGTFESFMALLLSVLPEGFETIVLPPGKIVLISYLGFLYLMGYWIIQQSAQTNVFKIRRYYQLLQLTMFILLVSFFLVKGDRLAYLYMLMLPLTIYFIPVFNKRKPGIYRYLMLFLLIFFCYYFQLK